MNIYTIILEILQLLSNAKSLAVFRLERLTVDYNNTPFVQVEVQPTTVVVLMKLAAHTYPLNKISIPERAGDQIFL